jgi:hypothetical protein
VAHACNPSYSGGKDQEDCGWKPVQANSSGDPILKNPSQKDGLVVWLEVKALSSSPSTEKKINIKNKKGDMILTNDIWTTSHANKLENTVKLDK